MQVGTDAQWLNSIFFISKKKYENKWLIIDIRIYLFDIFQKNTYSKLIFK
jgi:hypothetical protein